MWQYIVAVTVVVIFILVVRSIELKNKIAKCKGDFCRSNPIDRSCVKCGKVLSSYDQSIEDWLSLDPEEGSKLWVAFAVILIIYVCIIFMVVTK